MKSLSFVAFLAENRLLAIGSALIWHFNQLGILAPLHFPFLQQLYPVLRMKYLYWVLGAIENLLMGLAIRSLLLKRSFDLSILRVCVLLIYRHYLTRRSRGGQVNKSFRDEVHRIFNLFSELENVKALVHKWIILRLGLSLLRCERTLLTFNKCLLFS